MHRLEVVTISETHHVMKTWRIKMSGSRNVMFSVSEGSHDMESTYKGVNRSGQVDISVSQLVCESSCHWFNLSRSQWDLGSQHWHVTVSQCHGINMSASRQLWMQHVSKLKLSGSQHSFRVPQISINPLIFPGCVIHNIQTRVSCHFHFKTAAF